MVSRIVNNRNSRNGEFNLEFDMIVRLSIGLEMGEKGLLLLLRAAYPTIFSALDNRETFLMFISRLDDEKKCAERLKNKIIQNTVISDFTGMTVFFSSSDQNISHYRGKF